MLKRLLFIGLIAAILSLLLLGSRLEEVSFAQKPVVTFEPISRSPASHADGSRLEIVPISASESSKF